MILSFFQALNSPKENKYPIYYFVRGILQCCFIDKGKEKADSDTKRNGTADGRLRSSKEYFSDRISKIIYIHLHMFVNTELLG